MTDLSPRRPGGDSHKLPPQNLDAERSLLGALLLDVHANSPVFQELIDHDFYLQPHKDIFRCIANLYDQVNGADLVLVCESLTKQGLLDKVGGEDYLMSLVEQVPNAANAGLYAKVVRDAALRRRLVEQSTVIIQDAYENRGEARELLDKAEQAIFDIAENKDSNEFIPLPDVIDPLFDDLEKDQGGTGGLITGFKKFDELTNGLYPAQLIVVAGRPSMGKTTFAMNIAQSIAIEQGKHVGIFSLEVARNQMVQNLLCSCANVEAQKVRRGTLSQRQWQELIAAADKLREASIFIDDSPSLSTLDMKAKARRLKARFGLDLLVVDYLQLMHNPGIDNRQEEISNISRGLKGLARDLNIPVITISQLSRAVESREGHKPRLSDLRESGAIEQDADVVVLLYREEYYKRDDPEAKGKAEAILAKQRNGPTGSVKLAFRGEVLRFENIAYQSEEAY